jgi:hypothetical protein
MQPVSIKIRGDGGDYVHLECSEVAGLEDYEEIPAQVAIRASGFEARLAMGLTVARVRSFVGELRGLYEITRDEATLSSRGILLKLSLNHQGHVQLSGEVHDPLRAENHLSFCINLDQSFLPAVIEGFDAVLAPAT